VTITKAVYQSTMVARLCLLDGVVGSSLVLEDSMPIQIDIEDDESSEHPQDIHNFHVDLLYAPINDDYSDAFARTSVANEVA